MTHSKLGLAALVLGLTLGSATAHADPQVPSRIIHLVYDDSGSMIADPETKYKTYVDTWCQAKYAMEVLTAMLGENDKLNVYYMSSYNLASNHDFSNCKSKIKPQSVGIVHIHGSANASIIQQNVNTVQETTTVDGDTPFCPVVDAYQDLKNNTNDPKENKWLVILTDGQFEDSTSEITQKYYNDFSKDVNVVVLSIGKLVDTSIAANESNGLFIQHAKTSQDVLNELTQIGNRIFQRNTIPVSADNIFKLNIPMQKLIVFAQGDGVDVTSLTNANKQKSHAPITSVRATQPALTHATLRKRDTAKINEIIQGTNGKLNGQLATFSGFLDKRYFAPDNYHVDFAGAASKNVQIYYDPFVGVGIHVTDAQGQDVDPKTMEPGKYHVDLHFENPDSHETIENQFLKNPKTGEDPNIHGIITITSIDPDTGKEIQISKSEFDMSTDFDLQPGQRARIDYHGKFLEYNTVTSEGQPNGAFMLPFQLPKPKVAIQADNADGSGKDHASFGITASGFHEDGKPLHFKLEAKDYYGKPAEISNSDWNKLKFKLDPKEIANIATSLEVRKNPDHSIDIIPHFVEKGFSDIPSQKAEITITPEITSDTLDVEGSFKALVDFHNDIEADEFVFKPQAAPNYCIRCDGLDHADAPIQIAVSLKQHELTDDIWNAMQPPALALIKSNKSVEGFEDCQKTNEKGVFSCMPKWSDAALHQPFDTDEGPVQYQITSPALKMDALIAQAPAQPAAEQFIMDKEIDTGCWIMHYLGRLLAALAALILILGEIMKPRLPKMKHVTGRSHKLSDRSNTRRDDPISNRIKVSSPLVPFVAQTGTFYGTPDQTVEFRLKAKKGSSSRKMVITNLDSLIQQSKTDKLTISVNGQKITEDDTRPIPLSVGEKVIVITSPKREYTLNIE